MCYMIYQSAKTRYAELKESYNPMLSLLSDDQRETILVQLDELMQLNNQCVNNMRFSRITLVLTLTIHLAMIFLTDNFLIPFLGASILYAISIYWHFQGNKAFGLFIAANKQFHRQTTKHIEQSLKKEKSLT